MKKFIPLISWLALAAVIIPPLLYLGGSMDKPAMKNWMLLGTIVWFLTAPIWMGKSRQS